MITLAQAKHDINEIYVAALRARKDLSIEMEDHIGRAVNREIHPWLFGQRGEGFLRLLATLDASDWFDAASYKQVLEVVAWEPSIAAMLGDYELPIDVGRRWADDDRDDTYDDGYFYGRKKKKKQKQHKKQKQERTRQRAWH